MVVNGRVGGGCALTHFLTLMELVYGELLDKVGHLCQATLSI